MSFFGDLLGNEGSHLGNLFGNFGVKNGEQMLLGAADPLGAKLWGSVTGQNFTPMVGQLGGETGAQYDASDAQGVNTGPSRFMGGVANAVAGSMAGNYFGGGGGLLTSGSNALSGTGPAATASPVAMDGVTSLGVPGGPAYSPPGSDSSYPQQDQQQSAQQRLAAALMRAKQPDDTQGSALRNLSQLSNKTMALQMMQPSGGNQ